MTIEKKIEILAAIIEKARDGGWNDDELRATFPKELVEKHGIKFMQMALAESPQSIIFRHDFAKAFWGEEMGVVCVSSSHHCEGWHEGENGRYPRWQFHLERLVMKEQPLEYLEQFL